MKPRTRGTAPLVRAAIAYADAKDKDVANYMNISLSTLGRWKGSGPNSAEPTADQLRRLAAYCKVPPRFFQRGFADLDEGQTADRSNLVQRLDALEGTVRTAAAERRDLERQLAELSAEIEVRLLSRVDEVLAQNQQRRSGDSRSTGAGA